MESKEFWKMQKESKWFQKILLSPRLTKLLKDSKRIQKNLKDSERFQKIAKEYKKSKRFQKFPKDSKRLQKIAKDSKTLFGLSKNWCRMLRLKINENVSLCCAFGNLHIESKNESPLKSFQQHQDSGELREMGEFRSSAMWWSNNCGGKEWGGSTLNLERGLDTLQNLKN